ncbi:hypothetical protein ABNN70_00790 [Sporolactobacillus sp. Y61]|uniref:Uncharacterized protein n=1 Tax=Sporolactobacillus sp. Y61 TaxID=3160863 RepID=A0AAU8IFN2_9BACL
MITLHHANIGYIFFKALKQVRYDKNKDHDPLSHINLALLYGEISGLPGDIYDVKTIRNSLMWTSSNRRK